MNALDRLIAWVSPQAGAARARARMMQRNYDAATTGRRLAGVRKTSGTANDIIGGRHMAIAYTARDLVRNNAWAARGLAAVVTNTVGSGITGVPIGRNKLRAQRIKSEWDRWASSTVDVVNRLDFYGVQAMVMRTVAESGSCIVRRVTRDDLTVPVGMMVLEPDWLDQTKADDGIEYDSQGIATGYWIFDAQQDAQTRLTLRRSTLVPADQIIYVFRVDRPGQRVGMSWMAPIILDLNDFDGYEDAVLLRARMAACKVDYVIAPEGIAQNWQVSDKQEPGATEVLPYGTEIKSSAAPDSGDYVPFAKQRLRRIAAGFGLSYEALTGDLSETNFSSGRMGWLEMQRTIEHHRWHMLIPQCCDGVARWWSDAASRVGIDTRDIQWRWTPPRREVVDPSREYPALRDAMRASLLSLPEVHRSFGYDTTEVLEEIAATNAEMDRLGIKSDSDARNTAQSAPQPPQ